MSLENERCGHLDLLKHVTLKKRVSVAESIAAACGVCPAKRVCAHGQATRRKRKPLMAVETPDSTVLVPRWVFQDAQVVLDENARDRELGFPVQ